MGAENLITCLILSWNIWFSSQHRRLWNQTPCVFDGERESSEGFCTFFKPPPLKAKKEKSEQKLRGLFLQLCGGNLSPNPLISFCATADDDAAGDDRLWETLWKYVIFAESVHLRALGWNTPFSTPSKQKNILVIMPPIRCLVHGGDGDTVLRSLPKKCDLHVSQVEFRIWGILLV